MWRGYSGLDGSGGVGFGGVGGLVGLAAEKTFKEVIMGGLIFLVVWIVLEVIFGCVFFGKDRWRHD